MTRRGTPRSVALVAGGLAALALAAAVTAIAASGSVRASGGPIDAVHVVYDPISGTTARNVWANLVATTFTVADGAAPLLLVRYTADAACYTQLEPRPSCSVRLRLGKWVDDGADSRYDYTLVGLARLAEPPNKNRFAVESAEFLVGSLDPGRYLLAVQGKTNADADATFFRQLLVVEQVRGAGTPTPRPRPIVETRAATAGPFDSSEVLARWRTIASTTVDVPAGQSNMLLARFSAASNCVKVDTAVDIGPAQPCQASIRFRRIVEGGTEAVQSYPDAAIRFDDTGGGTYRSQRAEAVAGPVGPGTYEVFVRVNETHSWRLRSPLLVVDRVNVVAGNGLEVDR
jgi:hypothetical protein